MAIVINILRVIHILSAILMAWPFYALVAVNQRAKLGPPLGDRVDTYIENLIKNRAIPCYVFQATILLSGLALVFLRDQGLNTFIANPALGLKFAFLLLIAALLSYVYFGLQPRIDALFAEGGSPVKAELVPQISALRLRRKQMATFCLFFVLVNAMLGMQVWAAFPSWLTGVLLVAIALFTWRAYTSVTPYGWV
jgi:hypothetical protein